MRLCLRLRRMRLRLCRRRKVTRFLMNRDTVRVIVIIAVAAITVILFYVIKSQSSINEAETAYQSGDMEKAEELILRNLKEYPDLVRDKDIQYRRLGEIYHERGDFTSAEKYFHLALGENPDIGLAHFRLGLYRLRQSVLKEAIYHFEKAIKLNNLPDNEKAILKEKLADSAFRYGVINYSSRKKEESEKYFKLALLGNKDFAEANHYLGRLALEKRKYREAWTYYEKALNRNPNLTIVYEDITKLLSRMGRAGDAAKYRKRYNEIVAKRRKFYENQTLRD